MNIQYRYPGTMYGSHVIAGWCKFQKHWVGSRWPGISINRNPKYCFLSPTVVMCIATTPNPDHHGVHMSLLLLLLSLNSAPSRPRYSIVIVQMSRNFSLKGLPHIKALVLTCFTFVATSSTCIYNYTNCWYNQSIISWWITYFTSLLQLITLLY
jgi:hypothetical protein